MTEIAILKQHFNYDPETGVFTRIKSRMRHCVNKPVGMFKSQSGYYVLSIGNDQYQSHRVAWAITYGKWPDGDIDHINRVRTDNRLANLRECTRGQNRLNSHRPQKSSTGFKGVSYNRLNPKTPFRARVCINGEKVFDKSFATAEEASVAAIEARNRFHGEFARHC
jgi:hypothetical protein